MTALTEFRTLGRSGLKVSPLAFGAMTFGWGAEKETARRLLARYLDKGGNFVDTADLYANGASEVWLGEMLATDGARERVVLATKIGFGSVQGDPNAGGNGRKRIRKAIEGSRRRLRTDRVDVYEASRPEPKELDDFFGETMQGMVTGGTKVTSGT